MLLVFAIVLALLGHIGWAVVFGFLLVVVVLADGLTAACKLYESTHATHRRR